MAFVRVTFATHLCQSPAAGYIYSPNTAGNSTKESPLGKRHQIHKSRTFVNNKILNVNNSLFIKSADKKHGCCGCVVVAAHGQHLEKQFRSLLSLWQRRLLLGDNPTDTGTPTECHLSVLSVTADTLHSMIDTCAATRDAAGGQVEGVRVISRLTVLMFLVYVCAHFAGRQWTVTGQQVTPCLVRWRLLVTNVVMSLLRHVFIVCNVSSVMSTLNNLTCDKMWTRRRLTRSKTWNSKDFTC